MKIPKYFLVILLSISMITNFLLTSCDKTSTEITSTTEKSSSTAKTESQDEIDVHDITFGTINGEYNASTQCFEFYIGISNSQGNLFAADFDATLKISSPANIILKSENIKGNASEFKEYVTQYSGIQTLYQVSIKISDLKDIGFTSGILNIHVTCQDQEIDQSYNLIMPVLINLPPLPQEIGNFADLEWTKIKITDIHYEILPTGSVYLYFSGQKTFDPHGNFYRHTFKIGWRLYDSKNNLINNGTVYSPEISVGESFKDIKEIIFDLKPGETYTLQILSVS